MTHCSNAEFKFINQNSKLIRAASVQPYPITTMQPLFYCGDSVEGVKDQINAYCDTMKRSFYPVYDAFTQTVQPSSHIHRLQRSGTADMQAKKQREYFDNLAKAKQAGNSA